MNTIKTGDETLKLARQAHRDRTDHWNVMVGLNFVECMICHRHAHLTPDGQGLLEHQRGAMAPISAEEF